MTKQELLDAVASRYDELQSLNKISDFYNYEVEFVNIWKDLGKEVFEKNLGTLSKDKRKKKPHDTGLCNHKQQSHFQSGQKWFSDKPPYARINGLCRANGLL